MSVLVIGAGLVGSQIARILIESGERPVLMDRAPQPEALAEIADPAKFVLVQGDVLDAGALARILREHAIDRVVHLAANPMLTIGAQQDPRNAIELNILGTVNVLEAARTLGLQRVAVASSNVLNHHLAGGEGAGDAMDEEAFPRPLSIYASCKQAIESLGLNYARWFGVPFVALRYGAVAGPWSGAGGGGPSNVFLRLVREALSGAEAEVPAAALEWVYSKDAAAGTVAALRADALGNRVFNLTMGRLTTPEELCDAVRKVIPQARLRIAQPADGTPALVNMTRASSLKRAREALGFAPHYDMPAAVRDLVDWLKTRPSRS
jgi:nucleoside-diphosphate-sugar epimerase